MDFILKGFDQSELVRRFEFETIAEDRTRRTVVVSADLAAAREYNIPIQSLPLLCRRHLELSDPGAIAAGRVSITRTDMAAVSDATHQVAEQRKPRRVRAPISNRVGNAWRGPGDLAPSLKG